MEGTGRIEDIVFNALTAAYDVHESLGENGKAKIRENSFGDMALECDIAAEAAVINVLERSRIPMKISSEEHGIFNIGSGAPEHLAVLDGIDGTFVYKNERGVGRYNTMLGIFSNPDPTYDDYLVSAMMEHSTRRLFHATKGGGSFVTKDGKTEGIRCSKETSLAQVANNDGIIFVDEYFGINKALFSSKLKEDFNVRCLGSSSSYYNALAEGAAPLVLECTRKGNLEIASAYGMVKEAGGCIVGIGGESLGPKKYFDFGQNGEYSPVISAATPKLANNLIKHLQKNG